MKAIILAAGAGTRLSPLTNKIPKSLVKISGKPILGYQIENLIKNNIKNIIICVGYKADAIINFCKNNYPTADFDFVLNKNYKKTNNMYSLFLARRFLNREVLIMNGDVIFSSKIISATIKNNKSSIATDVGRYIGESMKVKIDSEGFICDISKQIKKEEAYGCSIDLYKFQKDDLSMIKQELNRIINKERKLNQWTEVLLQRLFKVKKLRIKPLNIRDEKWCEIDDFDDLNTAEKMFNKNFKEIARKKLFFIDGDGTLLVGNTKIKGADEFISYLTKKKILFYVLTNNSSKTKKEHYNKFKLLGFDIKENNILFSTDSLINFLSENKIKNIYLLANKNVSDYFVSKGFNLDFREPEAIVLTYDTEINYKKLVRATSLIRQGLPYFATHIDKLCPTEKGPVPDIGTFIEVLKASTGRVPDRTFGKPSPELITPILKDYNFTLKDYIIIGDRLYTDIKMANDLGILSVLVLSGETKREDVESSKIKPNIIVQNINELGDFI